MLPAPFALSLRATTASANPRTALLSFFRPSMTLACTCPCQRFSYFCRHSMSRALSLAAWIAIYSFTVTDLHRPKKLLPSLPAQPRLNGWLCPPLPTLAPSLRNANAPGSGPMWNRFG